MFGMYKYVEIYTEVFPIPTLQVFLACLFVCHCELVFHVALECAVAACRDATSRSDTVYRKDIRAEQTKGENSFTPTVPCSFSWLSATVSCIHGMRQSILGTWIGRNRCAQGTEN